MRKFIKCLLFATTLIAANIQYCNSMEKFININNIGRDKIFTKDYNKEYCDTLSKQYINEVIQSKPEYNQYINYVAKILDDLLIYEDYLTAIKDFFDNHKNMKLPFIHRDHLQRIDSIFSNFKYSKNNSNIQADNTEEIKHHDLFNTSTFSIKDFYYYLQNKINELKCNTMKALHDSILLQTETKEHDNNTIYTELIPYNSINNNSPNNLLKKKRKLKNEETKKQKTEQIFKDMTIKETNNLNNEILLNNNIIIDNVDINKEQNTIISINTNIADHMNEIIKQLRDVLEIAIKNSRNLIQQFFLPEFSMMYDNKSCDDDSIKYIRKVLNKMCTSCEESTSQFDKLLYNGSKLQSRFNNFHSQLIRTLETLPNKYLDENTEVCVSATNCSWNNNAVNYKLLFTQNNDNIKELKTILDNLYPKEAKKINFRLAYLPKLINAINIVKKLVDEQIEENLTTKNSILIDCEEEYYDFISCYLSITHDLLGQINGIAVDSCITLCKDLIFDFAKLYSCMIRAPLRLCRTNSYDGYDPKYCIKQILDINDGNLCSNYDKYKTTGD